MARADVHVHSKFSDHASEWFLQRIGANESYTEPEFIYKSAKARGMDFITITDHNKIDGALYLAEKYGDAFTGVESTVYFPEDRCKVHVLVYGLSLGEFDDIQKARTNIYDFRELIMNRGLAYSVAHATYPVNGKLTVEHLEKLILLFDVFEGINGGRNRLNNRGWTRILGSLTPERIEQLYTKHRIEPISETPWIKGITGGSDDHAGLFMSQTWTEVEAGTKEEFLKRLRSKETSAEGRSNNFQSLAFTIYKIAHDFSRHKGNILSRSVLSNLNDMIFEDKGLSLTERYKVWRMKGESRKSGDRITGALCELIDSLRDAKGWSTERRLEVVYDRISDLTDEFGKIVLQSLEKDLMSGNVSRIVTSISASIPGIFLSLPFFTTLSHLYSSRPVIEAAKERFCIKDDRKKRRILWFTDTLTHVNGVAVTTKKLAQLAYDKGHELVLVSSLNDEEITEEIPANYINIPYIHEFKLPGYELYDLRIPSMLKAIKRFYDFEPDEVIISTPGPLGLLGLITGKMMNTKVSGIYHTDFSEYVEKILDDAAIKDMLGTYCRWFFQSMHSIMVPSFEYMVILEKRGYDRSKMSVFEHGIDSNVFDETPLPENLHSMMPEEGVNLLYVGRISKEKGIDFLLDAYCSLRERRPHVNLIMAGDGPYLDDVRKRTEDDNRVVITGVLRRQDLPGLYSYADAFVFPSTTDTFGMVVLEAQSCKTPCLVSDVGGPQRIVKHGDTGYIIPAHDMDKWVSAMEMTVDMVLDGNGMLSSMREAARKNAVDNFSWDSVLDDLLGCVKDEKIEKQSGELVA